MDVYICLHSYGSCSRKVVRFPVSVFATCIFLLSFTAELKKFLSLSNFVVLPKHMLSTETKSQTIERLGDFGSELTNFEVTDI